MNIRIKYCFIFIFLSGLFLTKSYAQDPVLMRGDSLFESGNYFDASIEYERFIYHHPDHAEFKLAKYKKAMCYRYLDDYNEALRELNQISLFRIPDSLLIKVLYEKAMNHFLSGNYPEALLNLERIPGKQDHSKNKEVLPLQVLVLNSMRDFDEAKESLLLLCKSMDFDDNEKATLLSRIDSLYAEKSLPKTFSEKKAKHLSQFIPGAGQTYTGHAGEGAVSFLVNAALLGFGIHQLYFHYYFTAYIAGFSIFYKTYVGGMKRASYLASLETDNRMKEFNNTTINIIKQLYK